MICLCAQEDFDSIYEIINDAAQAYKGVIPSDRWKEPYMSKQELQHQIDQGVVFWGYKEDGALLGIMGIQHVQDVTLIRHAYVRTIRRNKGIGSALLSYLRSQTNRPILIGTWADAVWAVCFYAKHGFHPVSRQEKDRLLKKYWSIPERQIETSVVLAEEKWFNQRIGIVAIGVACVLGSICMSFAQGPVTGNETRRADMKITSPEFEHNTYIPKKFTCEGQDINPALVISDIPAQAKSLALIVDDPDAPMGTWVHWVVYDIPVGNRIGENTTPGKQGVNNSGIKKYHGPCPPSGTHRYFFKVYALDAALNLSEGISKGALEKAMQGHILDKAELIGLYKKER
jgi:Raf kinase inhibitor-like YbhB/YbcL family protein